MKFLNLMQHTLCENQLAEIRSRFCCEKEDKLSEIDSDSFNALKSISKDKSEIDLVRYAKKILSLGYSTLVVPIGNPFFMSILTKQAVGKDVKFLFSFSERKAVEKTDGEKVVKTTIFEHKRFDVLNFGEEKK